MVVRQGETAAYEALRVRRLGDVEVEGCTCMLELSGTEVEIGSMMVEEFIVPRG